MDLESMGGPQFAQQVHGAAAVASELEPVSHAEASDPSGIAEQSKNELPSIERRHLRSEWDDQCGAESQGLHGAHPLGQGLEQAWGAVGTHDRQRMRIEGQGDRFTGQRDGMGQCVAEDVLVSEMHAIKQA
jgi:hypothetical protein